jgi:hypothetical protein
MKNFADMWWRAQGNGNMMVVRKIAKNNDFRTCSYIVWGEDLELGLAGN